MSATPLVSSRAVRPPPPDSLGLWHAHGLRQVELPVCPSGHARLDAELPGGGWPLAGLSELLIEPGSGEWALLAPALCQWHEGRRRRVLCIAPPALPYAPGLHGLGLMPEQMLWVQTSDEADAAWAAEQALRAGLGDWVLWWPRRPASAMLRRLHLASIEGRSPLLALRAPAMRQQSSPAPLRLACQARPGRVLGIEVFKRRGAAMAAPLELLLPHPVPGAQPGRPAQALRPVAVAGSDALPSAGAANCGTGHARPRPSLRDVSQPRAAATAPATAPVTVDGAFHAVVVDPPAARAA